MQKSTSGQFKLATANNREIPFLESRAQLQRAERLRQRGKLKDARHICENLLSAFPDYVGALHTLGLVLADEGHLKAAASVLCDALALNPDETMVQLALSTIYVQLQAYEMAALLLEKVRQRNPEDSGAMIVLGEIYLAEKEYQRAADILEKAIKLETDPEIGRLSLAGAYIHLGRLDDAARILEPLASQKNPSVSTVYQLSQLPRDMVRLDLLSKLETSRKTLGMSDDEYESLSEFARAAALDKAGSHDSAWEVLKVANAKEFRKMKSEYRDDLSRRREFLARAGKSLKMDSKPKTVSGHPISLFIFGPSRSGKTSLERLVGSHAQVKKGYESPILSNVAKRTFQNAGYPTRSGIVSIPPELDELCRALYLHDLSDRAGKVKVFTNTHPGGIFDAYRLAILVPNARFVFMKRDIDDITFRIFGKLYKTGNAYSYDMDSAREYVQWYYDSIDEINRLLPHISTVVHYEEMIEAPERALKSVGRLCGLSFEAQSLEQIGDDRGCAEPYKSFINL